MIVCITASGKVQKQLIYDLIEDMFLPYADQELTLDAEETDLLHQIASAQIPVFDLSRALFSYLPPDGSETAVEARTESDMGDDEAGVTEDGRIDLTDLGLSAYQQGEVERRLHHAIRVRENLHPTTYTNGTRDFPDPMPETVSTVEGTKYYRNKSGKIRKAGKSKARPGETLVVLSDDELESLS